MTTITEKDYKDEVKASANYIVEQAVNDTRDNEPDLTGSDLKAAVSQRLYEYVIHEYVDGHEYVIYYCYHLDILQHSDNCDSALDEFGADMLADKLKDSGLDGLYQTLAYWAFYNDIHDLLGDEIYEQLNKQD